MAERMETALPLPPGDKFTRTDRYGLFKPIAGIPYWGPLMSANMDIVDAVVAALTSRIDALDARVVSQARRIAELEVLYGDGNGG